MLLVVMSRDKCCLASLQDRCDDLSTRSDHALLAATPCRLGRRSHVGIMFHAASALLDALVESFMRMQQNGHHGHTPELCNVQPDGKCVVTGSVTYVGMHVA